MEERPKLFTLPDFPPAGLLQRVDLPAHQFVRFAYLQFDTREFKIEAGYTNRIREHGRRVVQPLRTHIGCDNVDITVDDEHDFEAFLLTLAKIGYSYAVAHFGNLGAFNGNPIRALLRRERKDAANFVGGIYQIEQNLPTNFCTICIYG